MLHADTGRNADRLKAGLGAAAFQAVLGYALIYGLGYDVAKLPSETLKVFNITVDPPPPPIEEPVEEKSTEVEEGEASPPNLKSRPTPVVAPPPRIKLPTPTPVRTAPKALPNPTGNDPSAGASNVAGSGTGSGGFGSGTGSGGAGTGGGSGGAASRARRERGGFSTSDYRRLARGEPLSVSVSVRYTVGTDGRVRGCTVTRSSGRPDVDSTTCRLIEQRFNYRPARDAQGRPVAEVVNTVWSWEPR